MYSFVAMQVLTLLQFGGYTLVRNSKDLFESFGFQTQPVLVGLLIFQHTIMPIRTQMISRAIKLIAIEDVKRKVHILCALTGHTNVVHFHNS